LPALEYSLLLGTRLSPSAVLCQVSLSPPKNAGVCSSVGECWEKISLELFLGVTEKRKGNKDEISSLDYMVAVDVCVIASVQTPLTGYTVTIEMMVILCNDESIAL
jgi:hypothetical protein